MKLAVVICFRDEERYLPRLFASLALQTEPASQIMLVDDGSIDSSSALAREFATTSENVTLLTRERSGEDAVAHASARDRLAAAPELQGFTWGAERLRPDWEIVAKMDGDLELPETLFAEIRQALQADPGLGIVGSYLCVGSEEGFVREPHPPYHVRGPNKFYRRRCLLDIEPLPAHLGWDTIDELRARHLGWRTQAISPASGDVLHLRPTGSHDGRLRAYWRWGRCAWGYGAHPLAIAAGAVRRSLNPPIGIGGASYAAGWAAAGIRRAPRAERATRKFGQGEDLGRIRRTVSRRTADRPAQR